MNSSFRKRGRAERREREGGRGRGREREGEREKEGGRERRFLVFSEFSRKTSIGGGNLKLCIRE